ncbi:hypothetical protein SAMN05443507_11732 [Alicyclobacillus tolerans]|uniref:Uncharacterized protein n=1 Tax=Alicyclobacillus tolerans TaxID=90970 RepID=A0A1M6TPA2_9BACL|nr:hypothetical protein SAMN05443507_11732 [Alicyclobacillus montanus]
MGNFEQLIFISLVYLPYVLALVGIISLIVGLYFKKRKRSGKMYFLTSIVLMSIALFTFLVPGFLVLLVPH